MRGRNVATTRGNATLRAFVRFTSLTTTTASLPTRIDHLARNTFLSTPRTRTLRRSEVHAFLNDALCQHVTTSPSYHHRCPFHILITINSLGSLPPSVTRRPIIIRKVTSYIFHRNSNLMLISCGASQIGTPTRLIRQCYARVTFCGATLRPLLNLPIGRI